MDTNTDIDTNIRRLFRNGNAAGLNLVGADLAGLRFHGVNFSDADLRWADLTGCVFVYCTFTGTRFDGADIDDTTVFANCHFESANTAWLIDEQDLADRYGHWDLCKSIEDTMAVDAARCVNDWGHLPIEATATAPPAEATVLTGTAADDIGHRLQHEGAA